ncbi:MAG: glucose-1-phosphate adenylyltransferase subunit GlgD [Anaerovoracaceae bacterium]|jgi:glucose-1-phosphate adenylyltransferase
MDAAGIIFTDSFDAELGGLTNNRTLASIPFAGRYRLVDFPLSNMANAGIRNIGIITKKNYQSLMGHVRSGGDWDLDRKNGGLTVLPPFSRDNNSNGDVYENRLEGLLANTSYLKGLPEKYIIMSSCANVSNVDLEKVLEAHIQSGARITLLYAKNPLNCQKGIDSTCFRLDQDENVTELIVTDDRSDDMVISMNTFVFSRDDLMDILWKADRDNLESLRRDVIASIVQEGGAKAYGVDDPVLFIDNVSGYLASSLSLLEEEIQDQLFRNEKRPIITPARDSAPTRYGKNAKASNSLIADGAIIEGEVRNSVIFRGVHIKEGALVENSVVMQGAEISENARVNYAVIDKKALIDEERLLSGYVTHPFYAERKARI